MAGRTTPQRPASRLRQTLKVLASLLVVAVIFVLLFRRVDLAAVWAVIRDMTWIELATIAAIAVWNLATYWWLWVAVTPGLNYRQAVIVAQSGTALTNTVPGGSAIGVRLTYEMLESWGFSRGRSTLAVLITGIWNTFIKFGLPVVALVLVTAQGDASPQRVAAGLAGLGLLGAAVAGLAIMLGHEQVAARAGALAGRVASWFRALRRRPPVRGWDHAFLRFRERAVELLRGRWPVITLAAVVSHVSLYLVLLVALRHVGVTDDVVGWAQVLAVFALARLVTVVRFTPGGAGVVEAALIAGLVAAGGASAPVTAAVLVFRALTWLLPVPLGVLTYLAWYRQRRRPPSPADATRRVTRAGRQGERAGT